MKMSFSKMRIVLIVGLTAALFVSQSVFAMIYPTGSSISVPANNSYVCAGAQINCSGSNGTDMDELPDGPCGQDGETIQDNCVLHWYGDGSYPDGCMGTSVKWRAPGAAGTYVVKAAGDDTYAPDTSEYDWPCRSAYEITRTINVLIPVVEEYGFSSDTVPSDAQTPVYKRNRTVGGTSFESEMTSAPKNGHLGLDEVKFWFSNSLTYASSVQVDAGGTLDYDASPASFSGQTTSGAKLAGSGSNNLNNSIGIQTVSVSGFKYRVEYSVGVYSSWINISGGGSHPVALLLNPKGGKRKNVYTAASWATGATNDQEVYDRMASQKTGIVYSPSGGAQGDGILQDDPDGYSFTPSNPSLCYYLAGFLNQLAGCHGVTTGTVTSWWGGTTAGAYYNTNYPGGSLKYTAGGSSWYFTYHAMAKYGSKYYDICPSSGVVYADINAANGAFSSWYTLSGGGLRSASGLFPGPVAYYTWAW